MALLRADLLACNDQLPKHLTRQHHAASPKPMQAPFPATQYAAVQLLPPAYAGLARGQLHLPTQNGHSLQESSLQGGPLPDHLASVLVPGAGPSNLQRPAGTTESGSSGRLMQQQGADVEKGLLSRGSPGPPPVSLSASTAAPACVPHLVYSPDVGGCTSAARLHDRVRTAPDQELMNHVLACN